MEKNGKSFFLFVLTLFFLLLALIGALAYKLFTLEPRVPVIKETLKEYTYLVGYSWGQPDHQAKEDHVAFGDGSARTVICGRKFQSEDLDRIQEEALQRLKKENPDLPITVIPMAVSLINSKTVDTCNPQ